MSLTPAQIEIVRTTFYQIPDADRMAAKFYAFLFAIDPSTRPLFKGEMSKQRTKLIQTLAVVVGRLNDLGEVTSAVAELGKRHVAYGVTVGHWESVGYALLLALAETFGDAFTADVREAWATTYRLIADVAIHAAYPQEEQTR